MSVTCKLNQAGRQTKRSNTHWKGTLCCTKALLIVDLRILKSYLQRWIDIKETDPSSCPILTEASDFVDCFDQTEPLVEERPLTWLINSNTTANAKITSLDLHDCGLQDIEVSSVGITVMSEVGV